MPHDKTQQKVELYAGQVPHLIGLQPVVLGRFDFYAVWREVQKASGITIHVFGPRRGDREEVLRFDCFDLPAHFHLGWSYLDQPYIIIEDPDPVAWSFREMEINMNTLLAEADADSMERIEIENLKNALAVLRARVDELMATHSG
ncbi:MAG: hypothetical protein AAFV59_14225 [Pseudomonadota bacterium]